LKTAITSKKIDTWASKAADVPFEFDKLIIVVGCERDSSLQRYVCQLSDERKVDGKFLVSIVFWDDVQQFVKRDEDLLRVYYPNFFYSNEKVEEKYREVHSTKSNKRPKPVSSEAEIRNTCLGLIVKYRIEEYLHVDPYAGFSFDLVTEGDLFEVELQDLIRRALRYNASDRYYEATEFQDAFSQYTYYMSTICTSNGEFVKYTKPTYDGAEKEIVEQEQKLGKLRKEAMEKLKTIMDS